MVVHDCEHITFKSLELRKLNTKQVCHLIFGVQNNHFSIKGIT